MKSVLGNKKSIAVFVLPAFIIYAVFALFPIAYNIYMSLFKTDLMSGREFVGLKNYIGLFKDATFTHALGNNILMVIGSLIDINTTNPNKKFRGNIYGNSKNNTHWRKPNPAD